MVEQAASKMSGLGSKELKEAGLKATLPRLKILQILESTSTRHMSAEDIYRGLLESGEDLPIATIYRVLTQFESAGLVARHKFEGEHSVFELNEGSHHDHILCIECGRVEEFIDEIIEQRQQVIAAEHGFTITDHSLIIQGICAACREKTEKK
jgi:Fur family transcriptional regulator, ferric uptake regulator